MNIFRIAADMSHLLAIIILLLKIWKSRSCSGISARSQILFAVVFTARYLDLFTTYISFYNTAMKITFLVATYATIYLMFFKFRSTYMRESDTFRVELLLIPSVLLAVLINHDFTPFELLWTFSIYLEAVAILPQLFLLQSTGSAEVITAHYLFALGSYRGLYILNWIYRYYTEDYFDPIVVVAGIVQTVLYADFFYLYVTRVVQARKAMELPI
uniref:ER lumen protein-retaining receptor n=1 Tax=Caenorhabditis japonica TaxID=281687 RepID=A0A8R1HY37_CAEJA